MEDLCAKHMCGAEPRLLAMMNSFQSGHKMGSHTSLNGLSKIIAASKKGNG